MEQSLTQQTDSAPQPTPADEDQFEITGVDSVSKDMAELSLDSQTKDAAEKKDAESKLSTNSKAFVKPAAEKPKLAKSNRVFKPKEKPQEEEKHTAKLENKGKTFVPKNTDGGYEYEQDYQQQYADGYSEDYPQFNYGQPQYLDNEHIDIDDVEDDFLRFQNQTEQLEILKDEIGEFGEGLIRFEPQFNYFNLPLLMRKAREIVNAARD